LAVTPLGTGTGFLPIRDIDLNLSSWTGFFKRVAASEDRQSNLATNVFFPRLMIAITPFGVDRIDTPRPLLTAECCFTDE
jgi:hypothetical protein